VVSVVASKHSKRGSVEREEVVEADEEKEEEEEEEDKCRKR